MIGVAEVVGANGDHRRAKFAPRRDPQSTVVQKSADASFSYIQLVEDGAENDPGDEFAVALKRQRYCKQRYAVEEVVRSADRIDDPAVRGVRPFDFARFAGQESVFRAPPAEGLDKDPIGPPVGGGNEIAGPLD